jgi:hypothetical protein
MLLTARGVAVSRTILMVLTRNAGLYTLRTDVLSSFDILCSSATFAQPEFCPALLTRTFASHVHELSYVMLAQSKCHVPLLILRVRLTDDGLTVWQLTNYLPLATTTTCL